MSLTVGLAIAGGLVLAAVIAHGAWNARRKTPKTLAGTERAEPHFDSPPNASTGPEPALMPPSPEKKPGLDALIDVIAHIRLAEQPWVSGEAALAALPGTRRVGTKPFAIEGLNEKTHHWETPAANQRYSAFQAGVQLANRSGALNDIEFSEFVQKTTAFADQFEGDCDFPVMREEVARARELDEFAQNHDAQLAFTLRAKAASWSPGYLQQNAAQLGFVPGITPGRMVLPSSQAGQAPLVSLSFDTAAAMADDPELSALRECKLSLDVPQVERQEQAFVHMRQAAINLASRMEGVITDDAGTRIDTEAFDGVGADLERLYEQLDERDLSAGSPQARRLFS